LTNGRSPLKGSPLRNPGQSLDEEIHRVFEDEVDPYAMAVLALWAITVVEWFSAWRDLPRQPVIFTACTLAVTVGVGWRLIAVRKRVRQLRLGRDGERVVGQYLEGLREAGARIFHDVPGDGFNLDHVVISGRGIYVIETKTISKPRPDATVVYDGERVVISGRQPDRDPVRQAAAEADWLRGLLKASTGRHLRVRGVVVYPGWWVDQTHKEKRRDVWVLEPKALPGWIDHQDASLTPEDVAITAFHLSRYIRGESHT
jgi:hypothetical protein